MFQVETRISLLQTVLTLAKRAEYVERLVIWKVCVDRLELPSPRPTGGCKSANAAKVCKNCGESGHMSSQCSKKNVHLVEESTTARLAGSHDTMMVGSAGSYFDVGSGEHCRILQKRSSS